MELFCGEIIHTSNNHYWILADDLNYTVDMFDNKSLLGKILYITLNSGDISCELFSTHIANIHYLLYRLKYITINEDHFKILQYIHNNLEYFLFEGSLNNID